MTHGSKAENNRTSCNELRQAIKQAQKGEDCQFATNLDWMSLTQSRRYGLLKLRSSGAEVGGIFGDGALGGFVEAFGASGSDF